jgi:hypothetical protein
MQESDPRPEGGDLNKPATVALYDELPLWSAMGGLLLLEYVPLVGGTRVLDIGCGAGFPALATAGALVVVHPAAVAEQGGAEVLNGVESGRRSDVCRSQGSSGASWPLRLLPGEFNRVTLPIVGMWLAPSSLMFLRGHTGIRLYRAVLFLLRHVCGTSAARPPRIRQRLPPQGALTEAQKRALVIGVNRYPNLGGRRTVRSECLDHVLVYRRRHLDRVFRVYVSHYTEQTRDQPTRRGMRVPVHDRSRRDQADPERQTRHERGL